MRSDIEDERGGGGDAQRGDDIEASGSDEDEEEGGRDYGGMHRSVQEELSERLKTDAAEVGWSKFSQRFLYIYKISTRYILVRGFAYKVDTRMLCTYVGRLWVCRAYVGLWVCRAFVCCGFVGHLFLPVG